MVLIINGHDWSDAIETKGFGWTRNDLDTDQSKRTKDGVLRRQKIGTKRKLSFKTRPLARERLSQLDEDLSAAFFDATYLDVHGVQTRTFYCSSFETALVQAGDGDGQWASASFRLIEK